MRIGIFVFFDSQRREGKGRNEGLDITDEDNDDDEVMIDFYVADKRCRWWQMKRQTVLNFPHQHQRKATPQTGSYSSPYAHPHADDTDEQSMGHERKAINAVIVRWQETSK